MTALTVAVDIVKQPKHLATSDLTMPAHRWDGKPRSHLDAATAGVISRSEAGRPISVCMETNAEKALKIFTDTLTAKD